MRKGRDGEKREKKTGGKKKEKTDEKSGHYVIASSRPNADHWNAARSRQLPLFSSIFVKMKLHAVR